MCQDRILRLLERSKKPLKPSEIADKLKLSTASVWHSCKVMETRKEIKSVKRQFRTEGSGPRMAKYYFV